MSDKEGACIEEVLFARFRSILMSEFQMDAKKTRLAIRALKQGVCPCLILCDFWEQEEALERS